MSKLFSLFILTILILGCAKQNTILLQGTYKGKNLFIENPKCNNEYSIESLSVNGTKITEEINSSAIEIDFKTIGIQEGEKIAIEIKCKSDCKARILNSEAFN